MLECSHKVKDSKDLSKHLLTTDLIYSVFFLSLFLFICAWQTRHFCSQTQTHRFYITQLYANTIRMKSLVPAVKMETPDGLLTRTNLEITLMRTYGFLSILFFQYHPSFTHTKTYLTTSS